MTAELTDRIASSSAWAAYGDALGFISELTDARGVARRLGGVGDLGIPEAEIPWLDAPLMDWPLQVTVPWRRHIGGRQGAFAQLLPGCYSDDTQLRLATSRALSAKHGFDLEAFARIELPVFLAYSLGAGRATKQAAGNLTKPRSSWIVNSYPGWTDAGGNGVLVRIQPHAWAAVANGQALARLMLDVLKNGLCTHGHPRALLSSCAYAWLITRALGRSARPIDFRDLQYAADNASRVTEIISSDPDLIKFIIPAWEEASGKSFSVAWSETAKELFAELNLLADVIPGGAEELGESAKVKAYHALLTRLNMFSPEKRGSGIGTLVAAAALCLLFPNDPNSAVRLAAGMIGSDTDSIATVAAGLLGCGASPSSLPGPLLDEAYIRSEAVRVASLRSATHPDFSYPDILFWVPPRTQADAVMATEGRIFVSGLGYATPQGAIFDSPSQFSWQWLRLETGQSLLAKRRQDIPEVDSGEIFHFLPADLSISRKVVDAPAESAERGDSAIAARLEKAAARRRPPRRTTDFEQGLLLPDSYDDESAPVRLSSPSEVPTVEAALREVRASNYASSVIGRLFIDLSLHASPDMAIGFAAIVSREIERELGPRLKHR